MGARRGHARGARREPGIVVFAVGALVESPGILDRMLRVVTTLARVRMTTVAYR